MAPPFARLVEPPSETLHPSPSGRRTLVLEHDAAVEQFLTDAVSLGEVFAIPGRLARRDALGDPLLRYARRGRAQEFVRVALQETEHRAERLELARGLRIALEHGVGELVQLGDRFGGADVVVHRLLEAPRMRPVPVDA